MEKNSPPPLRVLRAIARGEKVHAYENAKGKLCFTSDADGLRSVLYLTLTCRALEARSDIYRINRLIPTMLRLTE